MRCKAGRFYGRGLPPKARQGLVASGGCCPDAGGSNLVGSVVGIDRAAGNTPTEEDIPIQQSEAALRPRGQPSPNEPSQQERERHDLTPLPYRRWCSVCVQAKGKRSPQPTTQDRKPVTQIDFAFMSTKEQPGTAVTIFTGLDVRTQMAMAVIVPSKSVSRYGLT